MATLMPINSPRRLISGPPLLPGLIDASVCNQSMTSSGSFSVAGRRLFELRMPRVTEPPKPNGLPKASTVSPSSKSSSSANLTELNFSPFFVLIFKSATSVSDVSEIFSHSYSRPSNRRTQTRLARLTTWKFVSTYPSSSMITPEPRLCWVFGARRR